MEEYNKAKENEDISNLSINQQVDYKFYMLNNINNINKENEINNGLNALWALSSPKKVIDQISDPRKLINCILAILIFLLLGALVAFFLAHFYWTQLGAKGNTYNISGKKGYNYEIIGKNHPKLIYLLTYIPLLIGFVIVILICLFFYKCYLFEIQRAYKLLSYKSKESPPTPTQTNIPQTSQTNIPQTPQLRGSAEFLN
jgi:hypothetical protein